MLENTACPAVASSEPVTNSTSKGKKVVTDGSQAEAVPAAADLEDTDPRLPQNWSRMRRWLIIIVLSLMSLMVSMSLVINAPASTSIEKEFNNYDNFLSIFYITVPNLGQVVSAFYVGPLSERFGRIPILHLFNVLFLIFTMVAGFSNSFSMIIAFRFLGGASIASIGLNPSITGDLFPIHERGSAMSITSLIPILGSAVGPIAGGYITQYLSWRWTFWIMAILTAALMPILVIVMRESYVPVIRRRALKKARLNEEKVKSPPKYFRGWNMTTVKALSLLVVRPFVILGSSRIAVLMAVYIGVIFGYLSLLASTNATVFQEVYGFSESESGLIYIATTIGTISGMIMCRFTLDFFLLRGFSMKKPDANAIPRPENRLIPTIPAMVAFPAGLLIYGWSLEKRLHWVVPALATVLYGFSLSSSVTPIMNYLVDIFGDRSASAVAACLPLRYIGGAFLPVAAPYLYDRLGYGWANTLLAFILIAVVPVIFLAIVRPQKVGVPTRVSPS
ncbi:MFS general substrate transporter [Daldinia sp. FL1419]|nr:MFS general substrate transporter [Daldinia sp. FL1419]